MSADACPDSRRARRFSSALFIPLIVWPVTWLLLISSGRLNTYACAWTQWVSFFHPSRIELQIDGAEHLQAGVLMAQVRLGDRVLCQTEIGTGGLHGPERRQLQLPLRAFGALEIRVASVDAQGCTQASGIARLHTAGEDRVALPIRLLPLRQKHCSRAEPADLHHHAQGGEPSIAGQD